MNDCLVTLNVCFDNDSAGLSALENLRIYDFNSVSFQDCTPKHDDWNEVLKSKGVI